MKIFFVIAFENGFFTTPSRENKEKKVKIIWFGVSPRGDLC